MMSTLMTVREKSDYDFLYPHEFDYICVVVPNTQSFYFAVEKIFQSLPIKLIPVTLIIFIIIWKLFRIILKSSNRDWSHIVLDTLGMYFATNATYVTSATAERFFQILIYAFSIITGVVLSGLLYQSIVVGYRHKNINRLDELADSNYEILINKEIANKIDEWDENLK